MADNSVTLVGNLTRDPELRFTNGGRAVASFGLAVNRRYQVNGEWQEQTSYFNIVAWGQLGENAAQTLNKGSRAIVTGRLEQRQYENRDGEQRNIVEIVADEIGPSLRWATAQIERTARTSGEGAAPERAAPSTSGGGGSTRRDDAGFGGGYGDEEPF